MLRPMLSTSAKAPPVGASDRRPFAGAAIAIVLGALTSLACGPQKASADDPTVKAQKIWQTRCSNCHGTLGAGDGPSAAGLDPKPRSFQSPGWQQSVDDDRIRKVIVHGGASVGLSPAMAPNPDLDGDKAVLDALVLKIRKLQK